MGGPACIERGHIDRDSIYSGFKCDGSNEDGSARIQGNLAIFLKMKGCGELYVFIQGYE